MVEFRRSPRSSVHFEPGKLEPMPYVIDAVPIAGKRKRSSVDVGVVYCSP